MINEPYNGTTSFELRSTLITFFSEEKSYFNETVSLKRDKKIKEPKNKKRVNK